MPTAMSTIAPANSCIRGAPVNAKASGAADTGAADTGAADTGAADTGAADTGALVTGGVVDAAAVTTVLTEAVEGGEVTFVVFVGLFGVTVFPVAVVVLVITPLAWSPEVTL